MPFQDLLLHISFHDSGLWIEWQLGVGKEKMNQMMFRREILNQIWHVVKLLVDHHSLQLIVLWQYDESSIDSNIIRRLQIDTHISQKWYMELSLGNFFQGPKRFVKLHNCRLSNSKLEICQDWNIGKIVCPLQNCSFWSPPWVSKIHIICIKENLETMKQIFGFIWMKKMIKSIKKTIIGVPPWHKDLQWFVCLWLNPKITKAMS
jgi:hypothetical protein